MRQIGARQETARLGGIGSCGRELCCSTWLTDFKSVNTSAARYQNLAINQAKLSGMCGRLKCCLNFELDSYLEALEDFPRHADKLKTQAHDAVLLKTDIFKRIMYYATIKDGRRGKVYTLPVDRVKEIIALNKAGKKPEGLVDHATLMLEAQQEEEKIDFESVNNVLELPMEKRNKKRKKASQKPKAIEDQENLDHQEAHARTARLKDQSRMAKIKGLKKKVVIIKGQKEMGLKQSRKMVATREEAIAEAVAHANLAHQEAQRKMEEHLKEVAIKKSNKLAVNMNSTL